MALTAPRFAGDPTLEDCLDGTHRMTFGEFGPAVRKIQEALIDLGFSLPVHGADSQFGTETGDAVSAYKRREGLSPADPVVGPGTMARLDRDFVDKPPAPFSDRDEWLSWSKRPADPLIGRFGFNFTRADELARRRAGASYGFDADSKWLPDFFLLLLAQTFEQMLDPFGSPIGPGTDPATWGIGPFDFYHGHVMLLRGSLLEPPTSFQTDRTDLASRRERLTRETAAVPGAVPTNAIWCQEFTHRMLASGYPIAAGQAAHRALADATVVNPLILLWHTFESSFWRPADFVPTTPRRHWSTQIAPTIQPIQSFPFFTPQDVQANTFELFQFSFLIDRKGLVTVLPGSGLEVMARKGMVWDDVLVATQPGTGSLPLQEQTGAYGCAAASTTNRLSSQA